LEFITAKNCGVHVASVRLSYPNLSGDVDFIISECRDAQVARLFLLYIIPKSTHPVASN